MDSDFLISFFTLSNIAIVFIGIFVVSICLLYLTTSAYPNLIPHESEKYFLCTDKKQSKCQLPSIYDNATVKLSVIIPAYNEEYRLPKMLDEMFAYLLERKKRNNNFSYEVIVVDDGSKDKTSETALVYSKTHGSNVVRVIKQFRNRGKGAAVRRGVLSCRGESILFADADGATKFSDIEALETSLKQLLKKTDKAVVCGSRAHLEEESKASRSAFRTVLMHGFHFLVSFLCVNDIRDTQCGFKLFSRPAAQLLFTNLHVERWAFDVDLLYLASHFNVEKSEIPVCWQEIEGSKIIPVFSWLQMGKDLLLIRLRYFIGAWRISYPKNKRN